MSIRRTTALALVAMMTLGSLPTLAQQPGTLGGNATKELKGAPEVHSVQVRDVETGQIVQTQPLDATGRFNVTGLDMNRNYLIELLQTTENEVLCVEGPFMLDSTSQPHKVDVEVECGNKALWLLLAAPAIGLLAARSPSGL